MLQTLLNKLTICDALNLDASRCFWQLALASCCCSS